MRVVLLQELYCMYVCCIGQELFILLNTYIVLLQHCFSVVLLFGLHHIIKTRNNSVVAEISDFLDTLSIVLRLCGFVNRYVGSYHAHFVTKETHRSLGCNC